MVWCILPLEKGDWHVLGEGTGMATQPQTDFFFF